MTESLERKWMVFIYTHRGRVMREVFSITPDGAKLKALKEAEAAGFLRGARPTRVDVKLA